MLSYTVQSVQRSLHETLGAVGNKFGATTEYLYYFASLSAKYY